MLLIIVGATVYSYLIPEQFKATSIVMVSQDNNNMGGLASLIATSGVGSFGAEMFGVTSSSQQIIFGILKSRTSLTDVIERFDLIEYYGIDDGNIDKALQSFSKDIVFEPTDNGMIEVSVINEDPYLSSTIANYFVQIADSINIELNIEQAKNNRIFIEQRYLINISDLRKAEDSMYNFQKKHEIFAVPEQLEASVKTAAQIEASLVQQELTAELLKQQFGSEFPLYLETVKQLEFLKERVKELKISSELSYPSNVLFPFSKAPEISLNYLRLFREIEIQSKIMEFVLPMYEQAKVDEQKSTPSLIILDKAVPPQLKHSPKKAFVILVFFFLGLFIHLPIVFIGDRVLTSDHLRNPLEEKQKIIFGKIAKIYRLDI
jgi:capsule polysaccharide export protein KpsE/RkpR